VHCGAVGKVGVDSIGGSLVDSLREVGMETRMVIRDPNVQTSATVGLITTDASGKVDRTFVHNPGGHGELTKEDITPEIIDYMARAKLVHVGYFGILPKLVADLPEVLQRVRDRNVELRRGGQINHEVRISLDTGGNQDAMAESGFIDKLKRTLPLVDIFIPSDNEAERFTGVKGRENIVRTLMEWGVRDIAGVKMGADGAYIERRFTSPGNGVFEPSFRLDRVIDTTGGGDSFYGGFLAGLVKGKDMPTCLRLGHACGAVCVSDWGASTGIKKLMQSREQLPGGLSEASKLLLDFAGPRPELLSATTVENLNPQKKLITS
jgi:fructokinase